MEVLELNIGQMLSKSPEKAFKLIYDRYFDDCCIIAFRIVQNKDAAQDIVQEVIMELWNKKDQIVINSSLEAYLKRAIRNRSLNFIKMKANNFLGDEELENFEFEENSAQDLIEIDELRSEIGSAIDALPEKCRVVFSLSRFEELSYQEIANELSISSKTVENQISKALKILRKKLIRE